MLPSRISITPAPRPAPGLVERALLAMAAGRLAEAIEALRQAAAAEPGNPLIQGELGQAHLLAGQPREALDPLRRAVTLDPRSATGHLRLGVALGSLGDAAGAAKAYEQAATLQPSLADAHYQLWRRYEPCLGPPAALRDA